MKTMLKTAAVGAALALSAGAAHAEFGETLKTVQERGTLQCTGHNGSFLGFAEVDDQGAWKGLDIDMCRAVAAAVLGDAAKLNIVPISWAQRWPSLQAGDVDVIIKASGGTFSRDTELGLQFSRAYYLGTTKIMAHADLGLTSLAEADGGSICIPAGTTIERQVASYADRIGINIEPVLFEKTEELREAYFSNRCDLYAQWGPTLAIARSVSEDPSAHVILDDVLAMEPEVMIGRQNDDQWIDILNWTLSALLFAEQEGVTLANVDEMKANPPTSEVGKMLGATPGIGGPLGLSDDWAYNVIKAVGNYGEIFDRNIGAGSVYDMPRGMNRLWNDGGVLFPMVFD
ncbi:amino acid ABC transporter substrate-binding protein [Phaeobacter gallaeciensis]|uniref:amino acid ABC transporter substrate-binding protein n=1 Tax=Phaeobacter gallaeciensis TaxID=60890 RepID=UPI00237EEE24|nr:amino acid ABC transporter substrate-binding protein [Phaeobacter gallaeciensis]MDE4063160.1 amino acid ABC transporter substrate-binding protein [Phaeobacter gallaeciensis]MDE4126202.1 amino acid ABC transporter substrate-binding protein [Phaeobacter gallaeciensis]MDE4130668.1 amino acid ABC transporter substrate-binding protein [Phaeobacter gallaeciensis]